MVQPTSQPLVFLAWQDRLSSGQSADPDMTGKIPAHAVHHCRPSRQEALPFLDQGEYKTQNSGVAPPCAPADSPVPATDPQRYSPSPAFH